MEMTFDFEKDDICFGCVHSRKKPLEKVSTFPVGRRFGCASPERIDFRKRADETSLSGKPLEKIETAIFGLQELQKDMDDFRENGWIEPVDSCIACPFFRKDSSGENPS